MMHGLKMLPCNKRLFDVIGVDMESLNLSNKDANISGDIIPQKLEVMGFWS